MPYKLKPIDLSRVSTYPLSTRFSKVTVADFAKPFYHGCSFKSFLDTLPDILASRDLRLITTSILEARRRGKPVIAGIGGHVIKCGLSPTLIELIKQGFINVLAMNGSCVVHDFEIAINGGTSEDVDVALKTGDFGMAEETGSVINRAIKLGAEEGIGIGEAVGRELGLLNPPYASYSLLHSAYEMSVPATVHLAIGTDITHIHPAADGASMGAATHTDFRLFAAAVKELDGGGVYLNIGSAVILPEVFLKAVTIVRNLGHRLEDFTTVNFDFIQHYRPLTNVIRRPVAGVGRGFSLTGHHEIMIPLLAAALIESK